jgi:glycosyltransferase involved in cell wall biosynthesis
MEVAVFEPWGSEGQAHYVHSLCEELSRYCKVVLVTGRKYLLKDEPKHYTVRLIANGLWFHNRSKILRVVKFVNYVKFLIRFYSYLRNLRPKVVHYQFLVLPVLDYYFVGLLKKKFTLVLTLHDLTPLTAKKYVRYKLTDTYLLFDKLIVHSEFAKNELIKLGNLSDDIIKTIPHGSYSYMYHTWPPVAKNEARRALKIDTEYVLVLVGSILHYKGPDIAIEITSILVQEYKLDVKLVVAGSSRGTSTRKLEQLITKYRIDSNILFINKLLSFAELRDVICCGDAGLMPYRKITTPGVAHMLQTYGIPIFCSKVGGFNDLIKEGINGIFIDINHIEHSASRIFQTLTDSKLMTHMANQSLLIMNKEHSWVNIAQETYDFYNE